MGNAPQGWYSVIICQSLHEPTGTLNLQPKLQRLYEMHYRMVPDVAKQFFPQMAIGFSYPRVTVHITDGIKYVQEAEENSFDVIIVDSSDPVGPAEVLFQKVTHASTSHALALAMPHAS